MPLVQAGRPLCRVGSWAMALLACGAVGSGHCQGILGPDFQSASYAVPENTLPRGECTWYVSGRVLETRGIRLPFPDSEGRDAYRWPEILKPTYVGSLTPQAGAIAVWTHSEIAKFGHVAYVERLLGDRVFFTEANFSADPAAEYGFDGVETLARDDFENKRCGQAGCWEFQGYLIPSKASSDLTFARLNFIGINRDAIQIRDAARPDGRLDGEFSLEFGETVPSRIVGLTLLLVDDNDNPILGQIWDTERGGYWMLGVMRNGEWVNPGDESIGIDVGAGVELRLFASDSGYFSPGLRYQLRARFVDSAELAVSVAIPEPKSQLDQSEGLAFEYLGIDSDVVSIRGPVQPDGHTDGVFALSIRAEDVRAVNNIEIHLVDEAGIPILGQVWDTQPAGYWMIGVSRAGQIVNPLDETLQLELNDEEQLLLYVSDSGYFQPGNRFRVTVTLSDGTRRAGYTVIASTNSQPLSGTVSVGSGDEASDVFRRIGGGDLATTKDIISAARQLAKIHSFDTITDALLRERLIQKAGAEFVYEEVVDAFIEATVDLMEERGAFGAGCPFGSFCHRDVMTALLMTGKNLSTLNLKSQIFDQVYLIAASWQETKEAIDALPCIESLPVEDQESLRDLYQIKSWIGSPFSVHCQTAW